MIFTKTNSFHQYSWNSEVETTWIISIGWPLRTSKTYICIKFRYSKKTTKIWPNQKSSLRFCHYSLLIKTSKPWGRLRQSFLAFSENLTFTKVIEAANWIMYAKKLQKCTFLYLFFTLMFKNQNIWIFLAWTLADKNNPWHFLLLSLIDKTIDKYFIPTT